MKAGSLYDCSACRSTLTKIFGEDKVCPHDGGWLRRKPQTSFPVFETGDYVIDAENEGESHALFLVSFTREDGTVVARNLMAETEQERARLWDLEPTKILVLLVLEDLKRIFSRLSDATPTEREELCELLADPSKVRHA